MGPVSHTPSTTSTNELKREIKRHNIEIQENGNNSDNDRNGFPDLLKVRGPSGADLVPPPARKTLHRSHNVNPLGARLVGSLFSHFTGYQEAAPWRSLFIFIRERARIR